MHIYKSLAKNPTPERNRHGSRLNSGRTRSNLRPYKSEVAPLKEINKH